MTDSRTKAVLSDAKSHLRSFVFARFAHAGYPIAALIFALAMWGCDKREDSLAELPIASEDTSAKSSADAFAADFRELLKASKFAEAEALIESSDYANLRAGLYAELAEAEFWAASESLSAGDFKGFGERLAAFKRRKDFESESRLIETARAESEKLFATNYYASVAELAKASADSFADAETLRILAISLLKSEDFKGAEKASKSVLEKAGDSDADWELYADCMIAQRNFAPLYAFLDAKAASNPYASAPYKLRARAMTASGDWNGATENYAKAAYYSKMDFETIVESGEFFIAADKLDNFRKLVSSIEKSPNAGVVARAGGAYLIAKAAQKEGVRNFEMILNAIDFAPILPNAYFIYAHWLAERGNAGDFELCVEVFETLSSRLKNRNDAVLLKESELLKYDSPILRYAAKNALSALSERFSNPRYGASTHRRELVEKLKKASEDKGEDSDIYKRMLKKVLEAAEKGA